MIIQTQNSTYIVERMPAGFPEGKTQRWVVWKFRKTPASQVVKYARGSPPFEGDTLTLGVGARMILTTLGGVENLNTSIVEGIEP